MDHGNENALEFQKIVGDLGDKGKDLKYEHLKYLTQEDNNEIASSLSTFGLKGIFRRLVSLEQATSFRPPGSEKNNGKYKFIFSGYFTYYLENYYNFSLFPILFT